MKQNTRLRELLLPGLNGLYSEGAVNVGIDCVDDGLRFKVNNHTVDWGGNMIDEMERCHTLKENFIGLCDDFRYKVRE